uniref:Uncharacterized protein n=1 Tax=Molossus molossus TaxID=27622 RepID=A0A7J8DC48_MOLMO|nr:hypothetical protein HJG59_009315 [Molossus molossus]
MSPTRPPHPNGRHPTGRPQGSRCGAQALRASHAPSLQVGAATCSPGSTGKQRRLTSGGHPPLPAQRAAKDVPSMQVARGGGGRRRAGLALPHAEVRKQHAPRDKVIKVSLFMAAENHRPMDANDWPPVLVPNNI